MLGISIQAKMLALLGLIAASVLTVFGLLSQADKQNHAPLTRAQQATVQSIETIRPHQDYLPK